MKISQNEIVTYDNRTAGDVLTYCSVLISNPDATRYELRLAKRLARKVNWHQMIGAGIVPDGGILYKGLMENIDWSFGSPTDYTLSQNYPNPFNPSTTIQYQIPQSGYVTLKVYDVLGNEVASLVDEMKQQGNYQVSFDASALSSGMYLYHLIANDFVQTKKMMLMK
ncbi:MAG: T9SS type A sorting domain-containing protein [Ignavibacteria bacterium]|nr:T9SS type A sorting domain-containing protein [Ignavibacteria bacterium]MBT8392882.1 T9SS type A sorting domain-containing protein [Ignavibacteria bacterium]NNJ51799.1 T9SS type A sorting domain-containing protein [Ignavibacteriaceae bacterium]NNL22636.1 T9SS type A sorting domain-containing protein [Ignavibacteriaceae bacterium]